MIDKSDAEQAAIAQIFPSSCVRVCYFHVLQAVQRWMRVRTHGVHGLFYLFFFFEIFLT